MEKYIVIKLASKQYLVHEGDVIKLERQKLPLKTEVLFYFDGEKAVIGDPEVKGVDFEISVLEEKLGKKVRVARFKKKSRYDKVRGHRQPISILKVENIGIKTKKKEGSEKPVEEEKEVKKEVKKETKKEVKKESKGTVEKKPVKTAEKPTTKEKAKEKVSKGDK
jgi:large subunit ribosomal protein L21